MHVLYRFAILYFGLYFLPFPISPFIGLASLPAPLRWIGDGAGAVAGAYQQGVSALAVWVGEKVLRLGSGAVVIQPTGSGDTVLGYVLSLSMLTLAVIGTVIWSLAARNRALSPRLVTAFRVYLRYAVASILLTYGFAKVPPMQFPLPGPELLIRTYGDSSPMGLLWTFMGFSPAYTMFAGFAELIPGVLLLFRQTATLGALIGAATMTNVVALNFAYDVPVKLFSGHLLVSLLVIAAPDVGRLLNFFVLNRPVPAAVLRAPQPATRRWLHLGVKVAFVLVIFTGQINGAYRRWYSTGGGAPALAVAGLYEVESFAVNGEPRPPLWGDTGRWRRLLVSRRANYAVVQSMGGADERFSFKHDEQAGAFVLGATGGKELFTLARTPAADGCLVLEGPFRGGVVKVELRKVADPAFPINTRGFHWIQELPYNR